MLSTQNYGAAMPDYYKVNVYRMANHALFIITITQLGQTTEFQTAAKVLFDLHHLCEGALKEKTTTTQLWFIAGIKPRLFKLVLCMKRSESLTQLEFPYQFLL